MNAQNPSYEVTSDDKLWAALAYFFPVIGPIIILFMEDKKNRPFIKAHNMQALLTGVIAAIVGGVLSPFTLGCIGLLVWLGMVYLAYRAYQGQVFEIPVITNFVRQQGW